MLCCFSFARVSATGRSELRDAPITLWLKGGVFLAFCAVVVDIVNYWHPITRHKTSFVYLLLSMAMLYSLIHDAYSCNENEDRLYSGGILRDLRPNTGLGWRFVWILMSLVSIISLPVVKSFLEVVDGPFFFWGCCIFYFFIAVVPLPPGRSAIRKLLDRLQASFRRPVSAPVQNR